MELIGNIVLGFSVAATPTNIFFCFVGVLLGTLIGVLPGIGAVATMSMLLPVTFHLPPATSLIMLPASTTAPSMAARRRRSS